jgi:hypothetical protein
MVWMRELEFDQVVLRPFAKIGSNDNSPQQATVWVQ